MSFAIPQSVALVTGANRGIGAALVDALLAAGARRVYATARRPDTLAPLMAQWRAAHGDRVLPLALDVTNREQVAAAVAAAPDVTLLINNAGVAALSFVPATDPAYVDALRAELDANVVGLHAVTLGFAPVLAANGGGAVANLSSVAAFASFPPFPTYSASKAAVHSLTQAMRMALKPQGISVHGVYPGPVDTDMAEQLPFEKTAPLAVAEAIVAGIARGDEEIFPDPMSQQMGAAFLADPKGLERQVAGMAG